MNISFVFADKPFELNTSNYRCFIPGKALADAGNKVALIPVQLFQENNQETADACNNSDIIIVERNFVGDVVTMLAFWKVRGKVIIANWDDSYFDIEPSNASYKYWHDGKAVIMQKDNVTGVEEQKEIQIFPHPLDQFSWGLNIAHAGIVPSKQLAKDYRRYTPTYYFPNFMQPDKYINIPKEKDDFVTIGWGGSISHFQSFANSGILLALKNICKIRKNVRVMICGDKNVFDSIDLPYEQKIYQNYVPYDQWGRIVAEKFDIGVAPLAGKYDRYRSWIKPMEYLLTKTPWIASDGPAYQEIRRYGKLIDNQPKIWERSLLNIIDNLDFEIDKASKEPYEFALTKDVNKNVDYLTNILLEIAQKHAKVSFSLQKLPLTNPEISDKIDNNKSDKNIEIKDNRIEIKIN